MTNTTERRRRYTGPILFSHGFRPFFLMAGIWAALAMTLWVAFLVSDTTIPSRLSGVDWHIHEMAFGYSSAVIAGFLMTAVPNWTGRMPVIGWPVAGLAGIWLAGRIALLISAWLPELLAPAIDISFLLILSAVIMREIIAGKNWRNLKILVLLALLAMANVIFHIEAANGAAFDGYGIRMAVAIIIMLISLVGGRVIPSFTRNWLARRGPGRLPVPMNRFDTATLALTALTLIFWTLLPESIPVRFAAGLAGLLHFIRLFRWVGWRTFSEPLVTILHAGYIFIPVGFAMIALGDMQPGWGRASQIPHAWNAGAIGVMTLAMMTRASLGHSGRAIQATRAISLIYIAVITAVIMRILAEFFPAADYLLHISATAWVLGFTGYVIVYFPIFTKPRI